MTQHGWRTGLRILCYFYRSNRIRLFCFIWDYNGASLRAGALATILPPQGAPA